MGMGGWGGSSVSTGLSLSQRHIGQLVAEPTVVMPTVAVSPSTEMNSWLGVYLVAKPRRPALLRIHREATR